jgi:hypothetical protein
VNIPHDSRRNFYDTPLAGGSAGVLFGDPQQQQLLPLLRKPMAQLLLFRESSLIFCISSVVMNFLPTLAFLQRQAAKLPVHTLRCTILTILLSFKT